MAQADYSKKAMLTAIQGIAPADPADLVAALDDLTQAGTFTPDYAIQAAINTNAYGFASADEFETVLSVIINLQQRVAALEAAAIAAGIAEAGS